MIEYGFFFLRHLNVLIDCATPEEKALFFGSTFPGKLYVDENGRCRTNSDDPIIQALFSPGAGFSKIKNGSESLFSLPSGGVEATGFEPVSKHILQKLSTCLFRH
jgi:hypothetical protein